MMLPASAGSGSLNALMLQVVFICMSEVNCEIALFLYERLKKSGIS